MGKDSLEEACAVAGPELWRFVKVNYGRHVALIARFDRLLAIDARFADRRFRVVFRIAAGRAPTHSEPGHQSRSAGEGTRVTFASTVAGNPSHPGMTVRVACAAP